MIATTFPEEAFCCLFLDVSEIIDLSTYFLWIHPTNFGSLHLFLKGPFIQAYPFSSPIFAWGNGISPLGFCSLQMENLLPQTRIKHAICLPEYFESSNLEKAMQIWKEIPFRIIYESHLTHEWDGIDYLMIFPESITEKGWRKIRGFIAAGGEVINYPNVEASLQLQ
jgi:hypothetical protein